MAWRSFVAMGDSFTEGMDDPYEDGRGYRGWADLVAARLAATATAEDPEREGWTVVDVGFADPERFADRVTGYGADAVVLSPDEARDAVVRRLRGLAS